MTLALPRRRHHRQQDGFNQKLIAPMLFGSVLNPINSSMIAVALVPIAHAFGAPTSDTAWLVSGLYLATAVGQPVVGRLVDTHGPRPLYLLGTGLVGAAGLLGALAPSLGLLIASRVLLGFGTCAAYPASMYLTRSEARRAGQDSPAGVLAALAVANQSIAVVGPTLGGLLIGLDGWRTIFLVNVPLSLACLYLGARRLPRGAALATDRHPSVDLAGMFAFAAALTAFMLFLMSPAPGRWYLPVAGSVLGAWFARRELHAEEPFIDVRVLGGNLPILATFARQLLTQVVAYSFLYGFTQWLEDGRGLHASQAGLVLLPMSVVALAISALTGRSPMVFGKLVVGGVSQLVACALLLVVGGGTAVWVLTVVTGVIGINQGLSSLANQNALYRQADPTRMGSSAGLFRTFGYAGALASSAVIAGVFGETAGTTGLHDLALVMLGCSVVLAVLILADPTLRRFTSTVKGSS